MVKIYLVAGPPFGPLFWEGVSRRLIHHSLSPVVVDLFKDTGSLIELEQELCQQLSSEDVLVAHGTAIPIAMGAAAKKRIRCLALTNGPIQRVDPFLATLSALPEQLRYFFLHPKISIPYFQSSLGLRRLVVNPYVMNHDTVVMVCMEGLKSKRTRRNFARYIGMFNKYKPNFSSIADEHLLVWGDDDPLYPNHLIDPMHSLFKNLRHIEIAGGKHLHPIERPWALADELLHALK